MFIRIPIPRKPKIDTKVSLSADKPEITIVTSGLDNSDLIIQTSGADIKFSPFPCFQLFVFSNGEPNPAICQGFTDGASVICNDCDAATPAELDFMLNYREILADHCPDWCLDEMRFRGASVTLKYLHVEHRGSYYINSLHDYYVYPLEFDLRSSFKESLYHHVTADGNQNVIALTIRLPAINDNIIKEDLLDYYHGLTEVKLRLTSTTLARTYTFSSDEKYRLTPKTIKNLLKTDETENGRCYQIQL